MPASRLALLFVLTACSDKLVAPYNTPPSASIISPVDEAMVDGSALIELSGVARDAQDDAMSLLVSWSSSVDGELGSGSPASSARVGSRSTVSTMAVSTTPWRNDEAVVPPPQPPPPPPPLPTAPLLSQP
jgi:hypothetical protein